MDEILLKQSVEDNGNPIIVPGTRSATFGTAQSHQSRAWTTNGQPD